MEDVSSAEDIKSEIRDFIVQTYLNGDGRGFNDDTDLQMSGILDSFAMAEVIDFLETSFDVTIETSRVSPSEYRTLESLTALVRRIQQVDAASPASNPH